MNSGLKAGRITAVTAVAFAMAFLFVSEPAAVPASRFAVAFADTTIAASPENAIASGARAEHREKPPENTPGSSEGVSTENPETSENPMKRYDHGLSLLDEGKKEEALEEFAALQRDLPGFALGHLGEGLVRLRGNEPARAVEPLSRAVQADPNLAAAWGYLGEALVGVDRQQEAIDALRRSLDLEPEKGRPALVLARLLLARGEFSEAASWFEVARESSQLPIGHASACVGLAIIAEEGRRFTDATTLYEEALEVTPEFPAALDRYANLEVFRGRYAEAVRLYERLLKARGENAETLALYGRALAYAGRAVDARRALERSLTLDPSQKDARALLDSLGSAGS